MYDKYHNRSGNYITREDDPRIPHGVRIRTLKSGAVSYKRWLLPISFGHLTLRQAYEYLQIVAAPQGKIPEVIRWTEGKESHLVKSFFYGGIDLKAHDYAHILLGRGLLPKDEAFVIGFTMGTTNKLQTMNKDVFAYIAKHYYPNAYQMDDDSRSVFMDAAKLGYVSDCDPLDQIDFTPYLDLTIDEVRKRIGLKASLLEAYYREIEQARFPEDPASMRLLPHTQVEDYWSFCSDDFVTTLREAASRSNELLDGTDEQFELDETSFEASLELAYKEMRLHLEGQRDLARMCFEEIGAILDDRDSCIAEDLRERRWEAFYQGALADLDFAKESARKEATHSMWEGKAGDESEPRVWVHALLGRGATARDRAFCRGFYDGSSNRQTTYAADLKLEIMQRGDASGDGLYSDNMRQSYHDGSRMGFISDCQPLDEIDFSKLEGFSLCEARKAVNLKTGVLAAYWNDIAGRRMLL